MYKNIAKFINKAQERRFNDALINVVVTEIKLKNSFINEELILPRYYNKGIWYQGEFYSQSAMIKDLLPKKALKELNTLLLESTNFEFDSITQIKNWIANQTGISDCSLSVTI